MALTFIHLTDTHVAETPESLVWFYGTGGALRTVLRHIARNDGHGASFMAHTGDVIISFKRPKCYECAKSIFGFKGRPAGLGPLTISAEGLDLPWYYIPGNTDDRPQCLARLFPDCSPTRFFNYSWELQGTRFLSLDWGASGVDHYTLEQESYTWLESQLEQRIPTILFTHHPPVHVGVPKFDVMTPPDLSRLQELIEPSSVIAIFHGHTHYTWENQIGDIPVFGTGSVAPRLSLQEHKNLVLEIHPIPYRVVTVNDDGSVSAPIHEVELRHD